jgi:hypothetical protein
MTNTTVAHDEDDAPVDRRQLVADLHNVALDLDEVQIALIAAGEDQADPAAIRAMVRQLHIQAGAIAVDLVLERPAPGAVAGS